jgi:uncharacterized membrane protein YeaQ/YmgE (transglycosylase-associated protein family)
MNVIAWIIIGVIIGATASVLPGQKKSFAGDVAIGVVGAFLGGWVATIFSSQSSLENINWYSALVAALGGIILIWVTRVLASDKAAR